MAEALITKRAGVFDHSKFSDGYEVAVKELIQAKINNAPIPKDEPSKSTTNVVNILDALRKSVGDAAPEKKPVASEPVAEPAASEKPKKAKKKTAA